jgi:hypothetical protein
VRHAEAWRNVLADDLEAGALECPTQCIRVEVSLDVVEAIQECLPRDVFRC